MALKTDVAELDGRVAAVTAGSDERKKICNQTFANATSGRNNMDIVCELYKSAKDPIIKLKEACEGRGADMEKISCSFIQDSNFANKEKSQLNFKLV